jgi:hypothetical protein
MKNGSKTRRERARLEALQGQALENGRTLAQLQVKVFSLEEAQKRPIPIILTCPECSTRHIDEGEWALRVHHTHSCQTCGMTWRPAVVATVGVRFLPGFKNEAP